MMATTATNAVKVVRSRISSNLPYLTLSITKRCMSTKMTLSDFANFHVPASLIAQSPAVPRDSSKLMVNYRNMSTLSVLKLLSSAYYFA